MFIFISLSESIFAPLTRGPHIYCKHKQQKQLISFSFFHKRAEHLRATLKFFIQSFTPNSLMTIDMHASCSLRLFSSCV